MHILFFKYGLPIIIIIGLQIYLSTRENKYLGLIIPSISVCIMLILTSNALETIGKLYAFLLMLLPNIISFGIYFIARKLKGLKEEQTIKLKWKNKKSRF